MRLTRSGSPIKPEQAAQITVCEWVKYKMPDVPFIHVANERSTSMFYGSILKRMGVLAGVSDIFLPRGNKFYKGLWIELKVGKNKLTKLQSDFLQAMLSEGYDAVCVHGADEAIKAIEHFYDLTNL